MEEAIDPARVIAQLQLENEMLRSHMRAFTEIRDIAGQIPASLESLWQKAVAHRMKLLVGFMILYWVLATGFMLHDRMR